VLPLVEYSNVITFIVKFSCIKGSPNSETAVCVEVDFLCPSAAHWQKLRLRYFSGSICVSPRCSSCFRNKSKVHLRSLNLRQYIILVPNLVKRRFRSLIIVWVSSPSNRVCTHVTSSRFFSQRPPSCLSYLFLGTAVSKLCSWLSDPGMDSTINHRTPEKFISRRKGKGK
jgi:hypothetical protein